MCTLILLARMLVLIMSIIYPNPPGPGARDEIKDTEAKYNHIISKQRGGEEWRGTRRPSGSMMREVNRNGCVVKSVK